MERVFDVIETGMLVQGKNVREFERKLSQYSKIQNVTVVSSGTAAIHLVVKALEIGPGDSVILPAFTFPATANAVENVGADTILCDVDPETYVVTPEAIELTINTHKDRNLKAVIVVHEFGYPARIAEIAEICQHHGLFLIEDAACALGTIADEKHPGYYSEAACFSFHPRKAITTGEGGAIMTRDDKLTEKIKMLRNHGIFNDGNGVDFLVAGLNYRLTDFQAALALGQLDRFEEELVARQKLADIYSLILEKHEKLCIPKIPEGHSLQSYMVVLDESIDRGQIISGMKQNGVETGLGAQALNCLKFFQQKYEYTSNSCVVATRLYQHGLVLPIYGDLTAGNIHSICSKLDQFL